MQHRYASHRQLARLGCACLLATAAGCGSSGGGGNGSGFTQTNLVSNQSGKAPVVDTHLANAWGLARTAAGPWWVADNHSGVSTLYDGNGTPFPSGAPLVVTVPPPAGSPPGAQSSPTGMVVNGTSDFVVSQGAASGPALFIFSTEDGTISGWNQTVDVGEAVLVIDDSDEGAIYKGLAIGSDHGSSRLYTTDFHNGTVDAYDGSFTEIESNTAFVDPGIPAGFAPFGVQTISGQIFVTYAKQDEDKEDDVAGPGNGYVDIFQPNGAFVRRFASKGQLNSPWGVVQAPETFGKFGGAILVGNFGDGKINAFDATSGAFLGQLNRPGGGAVVIPGLWGLVFGNDASAGSSDALYFTAGPDDEVNGLFGKLTANDSMSASSRRAHVATLGG
jgi:uncharacterized protein (TIGR03118 family)